MSLYHFFWKMTQAFVQLWNVCISEGENPEIGNVEKHQDWKLNIELKHNAIKNSKQLNWFDRIQ